MIDGFVVLVRRAGYSARRIAACRLASLVAQKPAVREAASSASPPGARPCAPEGPGAALQRSPSVRRGSRRAGQKDLLAVVRDGTKVYVLAVIEHGTRRIRIPGATGNPVQSWEMQQARNLLMDLEDAPMSVKFVLHDRDASFTAAFDAVFQAANCWTGP